METPKIKTYKGIAALWRCAKLSTKWAKDGSIAFLLEKCPDFPFYFEDLCRNGFELIPMIKRCLTSSLNASIEKILRWAYLEYCNRLPTVDTGHTNEIDVLKTNIQYGYAMEDFNLNRRKMVRKRLAPYLIIKKKLWIPYLFSFLPFSFYKFLLLHFSRFGYR